MPQLVVSLTFHFKTTSLFTTNNTPWEQLLFVTQSCPTLCNPMDCSSPGFPVLQNFPEFAQTHVHWVGDVIQPFHPLSSPSPLALHFSQHQGLFQWVGSSPQVGPKFWSFNLSISPSNEYSGLISFRIEWFDLLAVQGTLKSLQHHSSKPLQSEGHKSLLQHHSLKASILWHSAFFTVQLSHPYMTTGKAIPLTICDYICWQSNVSTF